MRVSSFAVGLFAGSFIASATLCAGGASAEKVRFLYTFTCPADQVAEGDRIFATHIDWMKKTHHREGEKALLSYDVSKTPELSDPFDPNSKPTGNTVFVLTEVYASAAGVDDHFKQSDESWKEFSDFKAWGAKCKQTKVRAAPIFNSLW